MKEAAGELNMTLITIVAIGLIGVFLIGTLWPAIQKTINDKWNKGEEGDYKPGTSYIIRR